MNLTVTGRQLERTIGVVRVRWLYLAFAAIAVLPIVLSLPFLGEPMEQDEGVYFSVVLSGKLPYAAVFDHKPPLVYAWYGLSLLLSGGEPSIALVRLLAAVHLAATALAVTWVGFLLGGRKVGLSAGFLVAFAASNQYLQFNGNTEAFLILPLTLSLGAFLVGLRDRRARWFVLAGVLAAVAAATKTVGGLHLVALLAVLVWSGAMGQLSWPVARRWSLAMAGGAAAIAAVVIAPFLLTGQLAEFWYANVTYNLGYSAAVSPLTKVLAFSEIEARVLAGGLLLWALAGIGAVLVVVRAVRTPQAALLATTIAMLLGASLTGREFGHYWVALLPFAALLAGVALARLTDDWHDVRRRLHVEALVGALGLLTFAAVVPLYFVGAGEAHLMKYGNGVNAKRAIDDPEVAAYIATLTEPGDTIFNLGRDAQLYVLADRRPATYFSRPLAAAEVDASTFDRTMAELRAAPPPLIVDTSYVDVRELGQGRFEGGGYNMDAERRARFEAFLIESYVLHATVEHAVIYLRKEP